MGTGVSFLSALFSKLKSNANEVIDATLLNNNSWFLLNDYSEGNKIVYLFKPDNELLVIRNGVIQKGKWEAISHSTNSIIIETASQAIFFNILYLSCEYLILQQDGTELLLGLAKQEKYKSQIDTKSFHELSDLYISDLKDELNAKNSRTNLAPINQLNKVDQSTSQDKLVSGRSLKYTFKTIYESHSLILHKLNGKWGYIDQDCNVVIDFIFDDAYPFNEDLASVTISGKRGYIDPQGNIVIPAQFDSATFFKNGVAEVSVGNERYKIGKDGGSIN